MPRTLPSNVGRIGASSFASEGPSATGERISIVLMRASIKPLAPGPRPGRWSAPGGSSMKKSAGVLAMLALAAIIRPGSAAAQFTVDNPTIEGAHGLILIPQNWNGSLFIYAHGYSADERLLQPFPSDITLANFTTKLPLLFQATVLPALAGYASATTTFRSVGWYVEDAIADIENLRRYFIDHYGQPMHTHIWGHSGGATVTDAVSASMPN